MDTGPEYSPRPNDRRDGWLFSAAAFAALAAVAAVIAAAIAAGQDTSSATATGAVQAVEVVLTEFAVTPSNLEVAPGTTLRLHVVNKGVLPHDLKLDGATGTAVLAPGASADTTFGPIDADRKAWCTVPGHLDAGMVMTITVKGATPAGDSTAAHANATSAASQSTAIDPNAKPAANWTGYDPKLRPATGGTEHKLTIRAVESVVEVAPGVTQELWTFDGKMPGTTLRGKVGDLFTITLVNDGKLGHSIDLHASKVAWNVEMRTIQPGESLTYQFQAKHAGAFMYHCGTAPALHHIGNGMFGAIIIDPLDLAPVAHEYLLVQSELYLGPQGKPGDLKKMINEQWDAVVFNGYWNQYAFAPIRVEPNERIRVWVVDDGPSENSAFHIVGTVFDTVYKEGAYQLRPDATRGGAQVLDLQPAQGGFVEFTFDAVGLYPIVTHKFANVGKGALGLFQAGAVTTTAAGGH